MLKETITYEDYNGVERTEDFYFNLTEAELFEMEMGIVGGFSEMLKKIASTQDAPSLIKIFKEIILKAYGEKSADGKRFIKSPEVSEGFAQTPAYSILYMRLALNADEASKFMNGLIPEKLKANSKQN